MTDTIPTPRPRRMARMPKQDVQPQKDKGERSASKLDQLTALLRRDAGASIAEMIEATGWQQHSVRGAMAGALKKRGLVITSAKADKIRRYRAGQGA